jgi:hypothetical protein
MQIKPLVKPTRTVIGYKGLQYAWYSFVSKGMYMLILSTRDGPVMGGEAACHRLRISR